LRIGATIPNFPLKTTDGSFKFHEWLTKEEDKPWTIFFSHPKDFTPVCTTELGACHKLAATAAKLNCKLIGLSCDDVDSHREWGKDVLARCGCEGDEVLNFPIIADSERTIVTELGMLDPEEKDGAGVPLPARALIILKGTTVKLTILYPATTGRNFEEVVRTLVSLQLTDGEGIATPANWFYGQRVIVAPNVATEDAKAKFQGLEIKELPSKKEYLRSVMCPAKACSRPGYIAGDAKLSSRDSGLCFCSIQ
jgi:1-Cys peroxiredoxin 6